MFVTIKQNVSIELMKIVFIVMDVVYIYIYKLSYGHTSLYYK